MDFRIAQGDIAQQSADALVGAAGTSLRTRSEAAEALRRVGDEALNGVAEATGRVERGAAAVTDDPGAEHVIHTAAVPHDGGGQATAESRSAAWNALEHADGLGRESVVTSALGCGTGGFGRADGARGRGE